MADEDDELLLITITKGDYEISYPVRADNLWRGFQDVLDREIFQLPPDIERLD